jgi:hypothetical protein
MAKIEIVESTSGDWQEVYLNGTLVRCHHISDNWWPVIVAALGHEVIEYEQPLDENGWFDGTRHLRHEIYRYTGEEEIDS